MAADYEAKRFADDAVTESARSKNASITDILRVLAQSYNAFGVVLWELKDTPPKTDQVTPINSSRLFTVASWFNCDDQTFAMHNLPVLGSKTGEAIRNNKPLIELDIPRNGGPFRNHPYLVKHGIHQMISVPITKSASDSRPSLQALNLYRTGEQPAFGQKELDGLEYHARLVNSILDTVEDRRVARILLEIDSLLLSELPPKIEGPMQAAMMRFERCCSALASLLACCEVSMYLSSRKDGDQFHPPITTLKTTLRPISTNGLTRWVLNNHRGIRILDLAHFKQDRDEIQKEYAGAEWTNSGDVEAFASAELKISDEKSLPPLSFMASPLLADGGCYGVIRCSVRRDGPSYFSDRDLKLLSAVGNRLGLTWRDAILQDALYAERGAWERLAKAIEGLNARIQSVKVTSHIDCIREASMKSQMFCRRSTLLMSGFYPPTRKTWNLQL